MNPKLDIIIPHYKEEWEIGEKLFTMLRLQRGIDFDDIRVTVINDGGHQLPTKCFRNIGYTVRQINVPHGGVSAARNAGIDNATAEWVMFCDFDDVFASLYALRDIMTVLPADGYDVLWSQMIAENLTDEEKFIYFTPKTQTWVFTHGKVYRRTFLNDNNIRFNTALTFNEDSEFNARIIARLDYHRIGEIKCQCPMYIWVKRDNSVTHSGRTDEATYGHFRRNLIVTQDNLECRGEEYFRGMVTRTVWDTWFMVNGRRTSKEMKHKILSEFVPWITERKDAFMKVSADILSQIREISRIELVDPDELIPDNPELVTAWVNTLIEREEKRNGNDHNESGTD